MDHRMDDRRETALSVLRILEKATNGNGAGELLVEYYLGEMSWYSFTENERWHMERAMKKFRAELIRAGFIHDGDADREKRP